MWHFGDVIGNKGIFGDVIGKVMSFEKGIYVMSLVLLHLCDVIGIVAFW
jgi:hypothetical protein